MNPRKRKEKRLNAKQERLERMAKGPIDITSSSPNTLFEAGSGNHYNLWRKNRLNKLYEILGGRDWFKDKLILELAAGHGHVGRELQELGAIVVFSDGSEENVEEIKKRCKENTEIFFIDQDEPWNLNRKFDLVIHWGVLYHLDNWEQDLKTALEHASLLCLETEVCDSDDPAHELKVPEHWYDGAKHGIGSRPSPAKIEKFLFEHNKKFVRYDDSSLNAHYHHYDWPIQNTKEAPGGQRRFWFIRENHEK